MRATRAYIASAGTAAVMLAGAAVCMLVLVSAYVAFGSWPGQASGKEVDQVLLNDVVRAKPQEVAVGAEAVKLARRAEVKRQIAQARGRGRNGAGRTKNGETVARTPAGTVAPTGAAGPVAAAPGGGDSRGSGPAGAVQEQTRNVTQKVQDTTQDVTNGVTNTVQNTADQTTGQVNQVVDQVVGDVQQQTQTTTQQVQNTVDTTTQTVTNTVGGLLP
jgi:gas vesicle protein